MESAVVVGAGQAGVQVVDSLRAGGYRGSVVLVGEEAELPYQRPPLSKDFMGEGREPAALPLRARRFFSDREIDLRLGRAAVRIDRDRRVVVLRGGEEIGYSTLVLATGATPRRLPLPGTDAAGVRELRTLGDATALRAALSTTRRAVVVGAGFIGLEFAAAARRRGVEVTVLEAATRPLERALSAETADFLTGAHREMGTALELGEGLVELEVEDGAVRAVVGTSGLRYPADLVLLGVGVRPCDDLARDAGLTVDDGIVVDGCLRTSDPAVYAIGDCARFPFGPDGALHRLESVQNAVGQGTHVARAILDETSERYGGLPWFWSDQGPVRLQIAGLARPDDTTVLTGDVPGGRFSAFRFRAGSLVAVESVNRPADHMAARRVLGTDRLPGPEQVAAPGFSLKQHATQLAAAS
ncbi:FAD-dependent oxidoreductase [Pseudonocardia sp. WMMC193]|uniref:NAD(P)/FAD-dependent oxidoreductase n=1 Tax=Pseudonocardia sp. WMMC193 TaxID=2911965 RepID=UPI001F3EA258|nr:FAD-dependent oxidoreductase [Pseudonocardia sp. WMMC193]MCF7550681.1 FAD-dependent oxidoreductase [Pseudonocardia sp. WMMC193]